MIIDGRCWGLGATSVGRRTPGLIKCDGCGRRIGKTKPPMWYEDRVFCVKCARERHEGCPCLTSMSPGD